MSLAAPILGRASPKIRFPNDPSIVALSTPRGLFYYVAVSPCLGASPNRHADLELEDTANIKKIRAVVLGEGCEASSSLTSVPQEQMEQWLVRLPGTALVVK